MATTNNNLRDNDLQMRFGGEKPDVSSQIYQDYKSIAAVLAISLTNLRE